MGAGVWAGAGRGAGDAAVVALSGKWRVMCLLLTSRSAVGAAALAGVTTAPEQPQHQPWVQLSQPGWPLSKSWAIVARRCQGCRYVAGCDGLGECPTLVGRVLVTAGVWAGAGEVPGSAAVMTLLVKEGNGRVLEASWSADGTSALAGEVPLPVMSRWKVESGKPLCRG